MPEVKSDITAKPYDISGPYHYAGDLHTCFMIRSPGMVIAAVYAPDGDEDAAYRRAIVMAHALTEGSSSDD